MRHKSFQLKNFLLTDVFRKLKLDAGIMSKWLGRFNGASGMVSVGIYENYLLFIMNNDLNFLNKLNGF